MKHIKHILSIVLLAILVSSCCKEELEAPGDSSQNSEAIDKIDNQPNTILLKEDTAPLPKPAQINDDGDEEDEDRNLSSTIN